MFPRKIVGKQEIQDSHLHPGQLPLLLRDSPPSRGQVARSRAASPPFGLVFQALGGYLPHPDRVPRPLRDNLRQLAQVPQPLPGSLPLLGLASRDRRYSHPLGGPALQPLGHTLPECDQAPLWDNPLPLGPLLRPLGDTSPHPGLAYRLLWGSPLHPARPSRPREDRLVAVHPPRAHRSHHAHPCRRRHLSRTRRRRLMRS
jgi:hypothetical protein